MRLPRFQSSTAPAERRRVSSGNSFAFVHCDDQMWVVDMVPSARRGGRGKGQGLPLIWRRRNGLRGTRHLHRRA